MVGAVALPLSRPLPGGCTPPRLLASPPVRWCLHGFQRPQLLLGCHRGPHCTGSDGSSHVRPQSLERSPDSLGEDAWAPG